MTPTSEEMAVNAFSESKSQVGNDEGRIVFNKGQRRYTSRVFGG